MPIYEYKCDTCGKIFEYNQKITDEPMTSCPMEICSSEHKGEGKVHRLLSRNVSLVFNGSGFYLTDYVHKKETFNGNGKSACTTCPAATAESCPGNK